MTVESQYKPVRYEGNGTAVTFPFAWLCLDAAWVRATVTVQDVETELTPAQDFTVSLLADSPGGSITLPAPLPQGKKITVWMSVPITQEHAYQNAGQLNVVTLEHAHDKHTLINQQLRADVDRSIKVPISSDNPPEILAELIFEARDQAYASAADAAASETNAAASAETAAALLEEITTEHGTALGDIGAAKADALSSMTQLRESTLSDVTREGQIQVGNVQQAASNVTLITTQAITDILDTGAQQEQRLRSVGDEQALNVILEGNAQEARVHASAAQATVEIAAQVQVASAEADRAKREADRAQDISNIGPASKTQRGWMIVGNGLRVDPDGKVHADIPSFLSLPVAGFPADVAIGYPATLSLSSETSIAGATVNRFMVVFDGAPAVEVQADTPGHATWTVTPTGTVHDQVGNIIVTAYDSNGNASNDATITFTKKIVEVAAPLVLSPVSGAVDVALLPVLTLQAGATTGMPSTNEQTQVQIARDAAFADMVWDSGEIAYATSVTVTSLLPDDAPLHSRARHKVSTYGWSAWGRASGFTTIKKAVLKPRILAPAQGAVNQSLSSTITLSALQTTGLAPAGRYTQVQLARDAAFADVVWDSGDASAYGVSKATSNLPVNTLLYCRGRHNDSNLGWSAWTDAVSFTTLNAYTSKPAVTAPANNAVDVARRPAVQVSAISNIGPVDYGVETQIHVATDAGFANIVQQHSGGYVTQWTPPADLGIFALYFVRVRHRGAAWGWSPWSDVVMFKTLNIYVNPPQVIAPANGATGVPLTPLLQMSQPSGVNQEIQGTTFHVATDENCTNVVAEGPYSVNNPLTWQVTPPLSINTLYYVRAWARGTITEWATGAISSFRTVNGWVNAPTLTSPVANATVAGDEVYFTSSAFSVSHTTDTHVATEFCLNKVVNGGETGVWSSGELTGASLLAFKANIPNFEEGVQYKAYVRHKGQNLGWGAWGGGVPVYIGSVRHILVIRSHFDNKYHMWSKKSTNAIDWGPLTAMDFPVQAGVNDYPRISGSSRGPWLIKYLGKLFVTSDFKTLKALPVYGANLQSAFYDHITGQFHLTYGTHICFGTDPFNLRSVSINLPGALHQIYSKIFHIGGSTFLCGVPTALSDYHTKSTALYETTDFQNFTPRPYPADPGYGWDMRVVKNAILATPGGVGEHTRTYMLSTNGRNWTTGTYVDTNSWSFGKAISTGAYYIMSKGKYVLAHVTLPFDVSDISDRNTENMYDIYSYLGNSDEIVAPDVIGYSGIKNYKWYKFTGKTKQLLPNPFSPQDILVMGDGALPACTISGV